MINRLDDLQLTQLAGKHNGPHHIVLYGRSKNLTTISLKIGHVTLDFLKKYQCSKQEKCHFMTSKYSCLRATGPKHSLKSLISLCVLNVCILNSQKCA